MQEEAGWIAELEGHVFDLLDAEAEFQTGPMRVEMKDGTYYLKAAPLEDLHEDQRLLAWRRSSDLVCCVNLVMCMLSPVFRGLQVAAVRWNPDPSPSHRFVFTQLDERRVRAAWRSRAGDTELVGGELAE